jgi:hypothetical protein
MRLDLMVHAALKSVRLECPIKSPVPAEYYRPDQIKEVPQEWRSLVALMHEIRKDKEFNVNGKRFDEYCALKTLTEAIVRDALECPYGTGIGFHADWKILTVLPQDQVGYVA